MILSRRYYKLLKFCIKILWKCEKSEKSVKKQIFNLHLECSALKYRSKYTTLVPLVILNCLPRPCMESLEKKDTILYYYSLFAVSR